MGLSLKHRLWIGLTAMLALMAIVAFTAIFKFSSVEKQANTITQQSQPSMIAALELKSSINATSKLLGYYMANKSKEDEKLFKDSIVSVEQQLEAFQNTANTIDNETLKTHTTQLKNLFTVYTTHLTRLDFLIKKFEFY